jgi:hypothetical protein
MSVMNCAASFDHLVGAGMLRTRGDRPSRCRRRFDQFSPPHGIDPESQEAGKS